MSDLAKIEKDLLSMGPEDRALLVDSLLRSLEQPTAEIDNEWAREANLRLAELRSGQVKPIEGEEVFEEVFARLAK